MTVEIICFDRAQLDAARLAQAKGDVNESSAHRNRMSTAEQEEEKVDNIVQATFTNAEDGIRAVESLLHHGVRAEDINLIRPEPHQTGTTQTAVAAEAVESEKAPISPIGYCHEAAVDLKEGAGLGKLILTEHEMRGDLTIML